MKKQRLDHSSVCFFFCAYCLLPSAYCLLPAAYWLFHSPLSIIVFPSRVTVHPGKWPPASNEALLSPPAQVLNPVPTLTIPACTQFPTLLAGQIFRLGLMPKST